MFDVDVRAELESPCDSERRFCKNCHSHFMKIRPFIKNVAVTKRFLKDLKDDREAESIVKDVLDCSNVDFSELHKFEETVDGSMIFRAKKHGVHIVYCVREMQIIFLRAFKNYTEYGKFLEDKNWIKKLLARL